LDVAQVSNQPTPTEKITMPRVLKAPPSTASSDLTPFAFDELNEVAVDQADTADRRAAEIVAAAQREAVGIRQRAEDAGRASGLESAEKLVAERVAAQAEMLLPALRQAIDGIETAKADCLARWEQASLDVALAIAARVIRREVRHAPEITLSLVRESLELAGGTSDVQIRMHPDDLTLLRTQVQQLAAEIGRLGEGAIVADAGISRGGCRVETRNGTIDQQFEAQLARIKQELC
jgi:flagellar biosynthesis/type III secretory pathway protein FliH